MSRVFRREFQVRRGEWVTVASNWSFKPKAVHIEIWSPVKISYRRVGLIPGLGSFRKRKISWLSMGFIQVRSRENRQGIAYLLDKPDPSVFSKESKD